MTKPRTPEELELEATINWERARDHAAMCRKEWELAGSPLLYTGHNEIDYEHPLHKVMVVADKEERAALDSIHKTKTGTGPGRKPVGAVAPQSLTPAAQRRAALRSVEGGKK